MRAEFYVTVEPTFSASGSVVRIAATSLTKNRPSRFTRNGSVTVKLAIDIPESAFLPLRPEVVIVVPEDMVRANLPIAVEATDPET